MCVHPDSKLRVFGRQTIAAGGTATAHLSTLPNEAMRDVVDEKVDHLPVPSYTEDGNQAKPQTWHAEGVCIAVLPNPHRHQDLPQKV